MKMQLGVIHPGLQTALIAPMRQPLQQLLAGQV